SLYHRARFNYYAISVNDKKRIEEIAYLANNYGQDWTVNELTKSARNLIRYDFGYEADAMRLTKWALDKSKTEKERKEIKRYTLSRILAKQGKYREAIKYIFEDMVNYDLNRPYMNSSDKTIQKGLEMKLAVSNLFEISSGRGGWYGEG